MLVKLKTNCLNSTRIKFAFEIQNTSRTELLPEGEETGYALNAWATFRDQTIKLKLQFRLLNTNFLLSAIMSSNKKELEVFSPLIVRIKFYVWQIRLTKSNRWNAHVFSFMYVSGGQLKNLCRTSVCRLY